ncbi:glycosyltransferase [Burkholderia stagnalis]|uniref:glycosyltransferase family 4 protein n=1 Tax=Burkholderia stagnalis TaxID=1503054 RepID=UPI000754D509|nr:glycosyltransferase family 4 protein [Burkholderia stagnalis]AOK52007.1 glycosyl transferase family 1 [Burkholderia stagnalis]KVN75541.1 glycosyl transferase family 1 [Burkholderia stagnalis]KWH47076.1 glycosyl transferase family 1 [Burkholderia stagnalis]KWH50624.1 glycosyl transferase family 1 [Burkholderia stagnalis]KWO34453.1 glycosyl transferase family 1 [Burkholderia stagnalis]
MKVLQFYRTYFPDTYGGVEQVIYQIARGAVARGVDMEVLSLSRRGNEGVHTIDNHRAHRARLDFEIASTGFSLQAVQRFAELARAADVIHYHYPWPFMDMVHFVTRIKKPSIVTYHSDIIRQKGLLKLYKPLQQQFLSSVDRIVATSPNYLATSETLRTYADKTTVIPIGLDEASYPSPNANLVKKWRTEVGERFFLFVGMIRYYKGLHILLDALRGTNLPVVIVGSGPVEAELKQQAQRLGLTTVRFLGALPDEDKVALFHLARALVFPSHLRSEAFGVSLLEGAMYAKPMISTEIGTGTSYINVHDETGLVVPPADPLALKNALRFICENPERACEMGRRGRERYEALFTADRMAERYVALYREVVAEHRSRC